MADVEKVARAICRAHTKSRTPSVEDVDGQVNTYWGLWVPEAEAALAAMGEREAKPVGLVYRFDPTTRWHLVEYEDQVPAREMFPQLEVAPVYVSSPRPEAVGEAVKAERERCARIARDSALGEQSEFGGAYDWACKEIADRIMDEVA